jgi:hypothetical protein
MRCGCEAGWPGYTQQPLQHCWDDWRMQECAAAVGLQWSGLQCAHRGVIKATDGCNETKVSEPVNTK